MNEYSALAVPVLSNGGEIWNLRGEKRIKNRLASVEKYFSEKLPGNALFGHKCNEEIL